MAKDKRPDLFAEFDKLRALLPPGPKPVPPPPPPPKAPPAWAVVRLEKKGRRGKEVTLVEKLGLRPAELEEWCRDLKQALGCGGAVEGDAIALQGDLRRRLPAVLEARGIGKITLAQG